MIRQSITSLYRVIATLIVLTPIAANIVFKGSILMSLLYIPLLSLALAVLFIYLDKAIVKALASYPRSSSPIKTSHSLGFGAAKTLSMSMSNRLFSCCRG